jgi:hypothetical protein
MTHKWTKDDDIVTYYLYRYGNESTIPLLHDIKIISEILGMSESSLRMRIGNFQAIDGAGGLDHFGLLSKKVYDEYKSIPREYHLKKVEEILENKSRK